MKMIIAAAAAAVVVAGPATAQFTTFSIQGDVADAPLRDVRASALSFGAHKPVENAADAARTLGALNPLPVAFKTVYGPHVAQFASAMETGRTIERLTIDAADGPRGEAFVRLELRNATVSKVKVEFDPDAQGGTSTTLFATIELGAQSITMRDAASGIQARLSP